MNSQDLRALQAPLKEQYKAKPELAQITLTATGELAAGLSCKVHTGHGTTAAGLHQATGGTGHLACSGNMLLEALVACAGVTLHAVATALDIDLTNPRLEAQGDLDFRGTLGVAKEIPVGFTAIRLSVAFDTEASDEQIATLLKLTERYCVVLQTLASGTEVTLARA